MAQVSVYRTPVVLIMSTRAFRRGLEDARAGVAFDWRIGGDDNSAWSYERGRQFAHIAPLDMKLWLGGKLNPKAIALCNAAIDRGQII